MSPKDPMPLAKGPEPSTVPSLRGTPGPRPAIWVNFLTSDLEDYFPWDVSPLDCGFQGVGGTHPNQAKCLNAAGISLMLYPVSRRPFLPTFLSVWQALVKEFSSC